MTNDDKVIDGYSVWKHRPIVNREPSLITIVAAITVACSVGAVCAVSDALKKLLTRSDE